MGDNWLGQLVRKLPGTVVRRGWRGQKWNAIMRPTAPLLRQVTPCILLLMYVVCVVLLELNSAWRVVTAFVPVSGGSDGGEGVEGVKVYTDAKTQHEGAPESGAGGGGGDQGS